MSADRSAWPQHLGTCRKCGKTYHLGTLCGSEGHVADSLTRIVRDR